MHNFTIALLAFYAIASWFPAAGILGSTPEIPRDVELPTLFGGGITSGVLLALACVVAAHVLLSRIRLRLTIRAVGANPKAARGPA